MKIDENKPPIVEPKRPSARDSAASRAASATATTPAQPASAGPAASVSLGGSASVAAVAASGVAPDTGLSDVELLEQLRERVEKGEFEIDYQSLAKSVLQDAMAAMTRRRNE